MENEITQIQGLKINRHSRGTIFVQNTQLHVSFLFFFPKNCTGHANVRKFCAFWTCALA